MEFIKSISYSGNARPIAADYDGAGNLISTTYATQDNVNKLVKNVSDLIEIEDANLTITLDQITSDIYASSYLLKQGTKEIGTINIPKDMVISYGSLKTVRFLDNPYYGAKVGDKYLDLVLANANNDHIYIPVSDLVDTYSAGNGLDLTDSNFSIKIDSDGESYLTVGENGLKLFGIDSILDTKVDKVSGKSLVLDTEIDKLSLLPSKTDLDTAVSEAKKSGDIAQSNLTTHINNTSNPHSVTKSQLGLGDVDNTSDKNKPISIATQTALDNKQDKSTAVTYSGTVGSALQPIYVTSTGAVAATTYQLNKTVPSDAKFTDTTYDVATTKVDGLLSSSDKSKLDGIEANSEVNQNAFSNIVVGTTTISAGSKTDSFTLYGSNVTLNSDKSKITIGINKDNVVSALGYTPPTKDTTYSNATTSTAGLMSVSDKLKLDGIAENANKYVLPNASTSTLGGIKVGTNLSIDGNGILNGAYSVVTTTANGLMSSADKSKLDKIESGAQVNTVTGVKGDSETSYRIGNINITKSNIGLSNVDNTSDSTKPISIATQTALDTKVDKISGKSLSTNDYTTTEKTKLAGIAENANNYSLPIATNSTLGGVKIGTNLTITNGILSSKDTTYSVVTTSTNGLMSSSDKSKLDSIATNANNYVLPTATTTTLGGVKVDNTLNATSTNPVQNSIVKTAIDEINSKLSWAKIN